MIEENPDRRILEFGKSESATDIYYMLDEILKMKKSPAKKLKLFKNKFFGKYQAYIRRFGNNHSTPYEEKFCHYRTYKYRGYSIKVYDDGYGQQDYFYFNNRSYSCGAYNLNSDNEIKYVIDSYLDGICYLSEIDKKYSGAKIEYSNHEHTDIIFTYRLEVLKEFHSDTGEFDIDSIKKECIDILDRLFVNPEFIESERQRIARGDLYMNELMKMEEEKGN